jgi:hypothetical protein
MPSGDHFRLLAPPGLTGWAQVHGGKLVTPEEKVLWIAGTSTMSACRLICAFCGSHVLRRSGATAGTTRF